MADAAGGLGNAGLADRDWGQIKAIFSAALDLEEPDRSAWLTQQCGNDLSLRQELERLLLFNDCGEGPLDRAASPAGAFPFAEEQEGLAPGDVLCSRFRILRFIGEGGMGEVFEAEDQVVGQHIALKTIRPEIALEPRLVERLRREVQLSRQVSHTNVCRVFELWQAERGQAPIFFLTMELLVGETVAQRIAAKGPFSPKEALPFIHQIAEGLAEVHRTGIVHRDLKPSNLYIVTKDDGLVRIVVTDFGLARPANPDDHSRTQTGNVFGTPAYMAPEQFESGEATFSSDIYSFGVTIFEMLTGRKHPLGLPSAFTDGIGPNWDLAVSRCLSPDPASRPATPGEVVSLLETKVKRPARRVKPLVFALGGFLILTSAAAWLIFQQPAPPQYRLWKKITQDAALNWEPSISGDGGTVVYSSDVSGRGDMDIWVKRVNENAPKRLTDNPANESTPVISRDGSQVAYNSERIPKGIYLRSVNGGPERLISPFGRQPAFSPDGREIAFWSGTEGQYGAPRGRVYVVDVQTLTRRELAPDFRDARTPAWSPSGDRILFEGCGPGCNDPETQRDWWIINHDGRDPVATGAFRATLRQGLAPYFDPPAWHDETIYFSARMANDLNLWQISSRAPFLQKGWKPLSIMSSTEAAVHPSISQHGSIAFAGLNAKDNVWLLRLSPGSSPVQQTFSGEINAMPSISRDGRMLYFWRQGAERRMILLGNNRDQLFNVEVPPLTRGLIAPDGNRIVYTKPRQKVRDMYARTGPRWNSELLVRRDSGELVDLYGADDALVANQDGIAHLDLRSGATKLLIRNGTLLFDRADVSPDGTKIAYLGSRDPEHSKVFIATFSGGSVDVARAYPVTTDQNWNDLPRWAPDGRAVLYISNRDGFMCIWKQPLDDKSEAHDPQSLIHFHHMRLSPAYLSRVAFNMAVSRDAIVYNIDDLSANVWIARPDVR